MNIIKPTLIGLLITTAFGGILYFFSTHVQVFNIFLVTVIVLGVSYIIGSSILNYIEETKEYEKE
jgi:heme O synthase-like polyprenyltransferase